jgi:diketogulonate reductase-like aldo/keto reductase
MGEIPDVTLNSGVRMPQLGFGVYKTPPEETERAVATAIEAGYRSIDTAKLYGNEAEVGKAVRASGVPREELFVTTKLWNDEHGYDAALAAFERSRQALDIGYVDLYLIHWPVPSQDRYVETWRALEKLLADGSVRAIGVSNFQPTHLRRLIDETDTVPALNQIELHPQLQQREARGFHAEHGIATEAWAPLARAGILDDPVVTRLAQKYSHTPAQVVLRWHLQLGTTAIPKSVTPSRIRENIDVVDFELQAADVEAISGMGEENRTGPHPDGM